MFAILFGSLGIIAIIGALAKPDLTLLMKNYISLKLRIMLSDYIGNITLNKGIYILTYYNENGIKYIHTFPKKRGLLKIISVFNNNQTNITKTFLEHLGPGHNFHGCKKTPNDFGYENITVRYLTHENTFSKDEFIVV